MPTPDFNRKITSERPYPSSSAIQSAVESDRGRIINSAAIRRLQQKTQVFPLERNAAVRSRLTHSLEVQQVGRFISQKIVQQLSQPGSQDYGFVALDRPIESLVEMACLMHDIGNPPFGHFGEAAINDWFKANINDLVDKAESFDLHQVYSDIRTDLIHFEGNAQAIRLISSLLKLNLTYTQAAAILKYTRPASLDKTAVPLDKSYLMKKPGYYLSEQKYVEALQSSLQMAPGCRHPLSYIMEAADDISYCYADIEDAVEKHILSVEQLYDLLIEAFEQQQISADEQVFDVGFGETVRWESFRQILNKAKAKFDKEAIDKANQFFINLRVSLNHILTTHAVNRFVTHLPAIFDGHFNYALLEDDSPAHKLTETFKSVALAHVFSHPEVELQELRGYRVIQGLLEYYKPLLTLSAAEFSGLMEKDRHGTKHLARESRLFNKLPGKHRKAYEEGLSEHQQKSAAELALWERYYRSRLMQDFISGMTDQYALDEYQSLMVTD